MKTISAECRAKINIGLSVLSKRADNMHELITLLQSVSLSDTLILTKAEKTFLSCSDPALPSNEANIVLKTLRLLEEFTCRHLPCKIELIKRTPFCAGLGGGSADSAGMIRAANELFELKIKQQEMEEIALLAGTDVPFMLSGGLCLCEGIGEKLTKKDFTGEFSLLIAKPSQGISTAEAYRAIDSEKERKSTDFDLVQKLLYTKNYSALTSAAFNDFQAYADRCCPLTGSYRELFYESGALFSALSGSGAAVFAIFGSEDEANKALLQLKDKMEKLYIARAADTSIVFN